MKIYTTRPFDEDYRDLPESIKDRADRQFVLLLENPHHPSLRLKKRFISKLVDPILEESLARARKERQIAPKASAGYSLAINLLLPFRKA